MGSFAEALSALMAERGVSGSALARQVPCDRALISRYLSGRQQPSQKMAGRVDEVLDAGGELAALESMRAVTAAPASGGAVELIELARCAEISEVGPATLETLEMAVDRLCGDYPTVAPGVLRAEATPYLRYVLSLLARRGTLSQHRELLVLAGWFAALLSCVCYDAGDKVSAEAARKMTLQLGRQAGHGELTAWAFEIAAWFALVEGRFPVVIELCDAGLAHAGISNAAAQLTMQAARGYARMGDNRASGALNAAEHILGQLPEPEHPEHHFKFDRDKVEFYAATIYTWLGTDDAAAEEHAREVAARCRGAAGQAVRWPTRLSTTLVNLGQIAARRGDLDEAVSLGTAALGCGRRSAELLPRATELGHVLAVRYPRERLVTQYGEALIEERRHLPPGDAERLSTALARRAGLSC